MNNSVSQRGVPATDGALALSENQDESIDFELLASVDDLRDELGLQVMCRVESEGSLF